MTNKPDLILAMDTASDAIALAVGRQDFSGDDPKISPVGLGDMLARREANVNLVPAIDRMFAQCSLGKADVACVVCGRGPGSFTGVRIAVATAKGIAAGLNAPLIGVATPDAQAWQAWMDGIRGQVMVLADAMRGEIYPARYLLDERGVLRQDTPTVIKADLLAKKLEGSEKDVLLMGDSLLKYEALFSSFVWLDERYWHPTGAGLLRAFEDMLGFAGFAANDSAGAQRSAHPEERVVLSNRAQGSHQSSAVITSDGNDLEKYTDAFSAKLNAGFSSQGGDDRLGGKADIVIPSEVRNLSVAGSVPHYVRRDPSPAAQDDIFTQREGRFDSSVASLLPIYTRLSDAEENERKRLVSGGAIAQGALIEIPASGVAWLQRCDQCSFRPAAKSDVEQMVELERAACKTSRGLPSDDCWTEAMFLDDLRKPDRSWWVAYLDNELIGFAGGMFLDAQMHILDIVVCREYQRQGIARKLLAHLARDAQDLGAAELTLEVRVSNVAAQALYSRLGFVEVGRRRSYYPALTDDGKREDGLIMTGNVDTALLCLSQHLPVFSDECSADTSDDTDAPHPLILAIESSCDETAAALIDGKGRLLTNVIASQTDFHSRFGGVVPEIASRKHTEAIYPAVMEALGNRSWDDLDAIAVTYAPGLIGALVVGLAFAKGLSWATDLPLIKVDHLEGHIYANRFVKRVSDDQANSLESHSQVETKSTVSNTYYLDDSHLQPPFVIALLSGGNTMLVYVRDWGEYELLGETLDDAVGEAYDKVAKALGLGYPGGPIIAQLAAEGNPQAIAFPRALLHSGDYRFSLSGLKTAVLTAIREHTEAGTLHIPDIAASFEQAVIDVQVAKALKACKSRGVKTFCIGGGVAANKALREAYRTAMEPQGIRVVFPPGIACTDNAAMIAAVALDRFRLGKFADLSDDALAHTRIDEAY